MGTLRIAFLSGSILELAATLGIALVAVVVGVRLAEGGIGFEAALTVLVLVPELYLPLRNLAAQFHASADGAAVAERLLELAEPAQARARGTAPPDPMLVPIRFEGVSFAYPSRDRRRAARPRSRDPPRTRRSRSSGRVGWGRARSSRCSCASPIPRRVASSWATTTSRSSTPTRWRALTALVPQQPTLFRGTVAENIRLGDPAADDERVRRAAELAGAHDFVTRLPLSLRHGRRGRRAAAVGRSATTHRSRARVPARRSARRARRADGGSRRSECGAGRGVDPPAANRANGRDRRARAGARRVGGPGRPARERSRAHGDGEGGMSTVERVLALSGVSRSRALLSLVARHARGRLRRRVDGDRRLSHLQGRRAAADPGAHDGHRRRPLPRPRAAARTLSRPPRVARPRAACPRTDPRECLRAHRAACAGRARRVSPRGPRESTGRGRGRAPGALSARSRAVVRRSRRVGRLCRHRRVRASGGRRRPRGSDSHSAGSRHRCSQEGSAAASAGARRRRGAS